MLTPNTPDGSSLRLFYNGPIGVAGVGVTQSLDLTSLPLSVRQDPTFEDNFLIIADPSAGITSIATEVEFTNDADGLPAAMVFTLDAAAEADEINLQAWYNHSVTR